MPVIWAKRECTDTENPTGTEGPTRPEHENNPRYTIHEPYSHYQLCSTRERNRGLFGGPVILNGTKATNTRQNPDGTPYGWECPEERDYYPYWHPTIWKDIAIQTDDAKNRCDLFTKQSQNVLDKGTCSLPTYNYPFLCKSNGGDWNNMGKFNIASPKCMAAPWSAPNQLGVTSNGHPYSFNWTLPTTSQPLRCVVRIRYNITSTDISKSADAQMNARFSPFQNDMEVQLDAKKDPNIWSNVTLGTNGKAIGKTFEDRSFVFNIIPRPAELQDKTIYNLNVRGKRGNLVDIFPAMLYDYVPNPLLMYHDSLVHIQWSGSDYNPPARDLPGLAGTDRHNFVQIENKGSNYPLPLSSWTIFSHLSDPFKTSISIRLATANQTLSQCDSASEKTDCSVLNLAPAVFSVPPVELKPGEYSFMCTRNNRFGQAIMKGTILVFDNTPNVFAYAIPIAIILGILFSLIIIFGLVAYKNPSIIKPQKGK
eukprot:TRINITY_DN2754_c0_g1_i1.p1 TRINITY_DN2754_c0_g1~~TRINITY_DN2754_c0_g1_i1.p1  ORF type:complete len:481 (+),score=57.53 TRINITY_DN2754_c0_g1_i1:466-1908(+)